jgi:hypothetical protein
MSTMRCPACGRRKGRRACPALGASICPVCCGTQRRVTIACPADCGYLSAAEQHPRAAVQRRRGRHAQWLLRVADGLTDRQAEIFLLLHALVAAAVARLAPEALTDRDVAAAAAALAATHDTAAKGIIYEHRAPSIAAERLVAELKAALRAAEAEGWRLGDTDLAAAFRRLEQAARDAANALGGERAYLALVGELFPPSRRAHGAAERAPRLIVP